MKTFLPAVLSVALFVGAIAFATAPTTRNVEYADQQQFTGGIKVGKTASTTKVAKITRCSMDHRFGALTNDGGTYACATSSWGATCTGAAVGDECSIGYKLPVPVNLEARTYQCYVSAADTVVVRACGAAGANATTDAGFNFTVFGR